MISLFFLIILLIIINDSLFKLFEINFTHKLKEYNFNNKEITIIIGYCTSVIILISSYYIKKILHIHENNLIINILGILIGLIILLRIH